MYVAKHPVRMVTAASLFDGHDAAINIMRRVLQSQGVEVIHLGHNRSVAEVVRVAVQEDVQGVAISSYQGGHMEYFTYLVELLAEHDAGHIKVYGGGGGVIVAEEIEELHRRGVARIFSPEDGQRLGLAGMINAMVRECDIDLSRIPSESLARRLTRIELGQAETPCLAADRPVPVLGITGTGGSGKSSLTDELVRRLRLDQDDKLRIAILAVDPSRSRGGGALLGDRIRMNAIGSDRVFFRSLSTRGSRDLPLHLHEMIAACKADGFDLVIVETPGMGQGDTAITDFADVSLYVMTPEFGAASQLEKIDMLDHADVVAINKFERHGGEDALRDVCRQLIRNRGAFGTPPEQMPVYGTIASRFNDDGVDALYHGLKDLLAAKGLPLQPGRIPVPTGRTSTRAAAIIPAQRVRYLADISATVSGYHAQTEKLVSLIRRRQQLAAVRELLPPDNREAVDRLHKGICEQLGDDAAGIEGWEQTAQAYAAQDLQVAGRTLPLVRTSLSGSQIRRVALPRGEEHGALMRYLRSENVPGSFPFTAGVFAFKREDEDPTRMFAGEGDPARTNRRFKLLSAHGAATRLSTAFDSVTLYGHDPALRPDIYGKIGTSGVSIATLADMKDLLDGFDLAAPSTSVSMTINGPAPTILAYFLNAALDQAPPEHRAKVLESIRGTVQADILKEDQGQNTCIFSTEFSLRMMADVQEWFIQNKVRNFYSVSISGYHIAEAGANPISQLAFTLANGFTYVEAYLARGMHIDDFAPNLSFFFSNGMDPEYTVLGRVARRIWAIAMRERYGANERSQKLKYHVQTSGRSLHAQEMNFNDIRTTLQALTAIYDNCNSLHTNAYDEAVTTPTAESVRRAMAIQLIINREWGLAINENPLQGSYIVDELTDLVEQAVLAEFERISSRGGVLGAMETGYQRGRIQDESMLYEQRKHDGTLPIIGVNTFRASAGEPGAALSELARGTEDERQSQLGRLEGFHNENAPEAEAALRSLRGAAATDTNLFAVLMDVARVCSLEQITQSLFEAGGQYRRSM